MSVMMISEVSGQSPHGYDGMLAFVGDALRQAPGFILHMSHPVEAGWRIVEAWNSQEDATRFFAARICAEPAGWHPPEAVLPATAQPVEILIGRPSPPLSRSA